MGPEVVAPVAFFSTVTIIVVARSQIGRALADRIRGGGAHDRELLAEVDALRAELDSVRQDFAEVQERLDFAERLLVRPAAGSTGPEIR
jgi:hypothetical protein